MSSISTKKNPTNPYQLNITFSFVCIMSYSQPLYFPQYFFTSLFSRGHPILVLKSFFPHNSNFSLLPGIFFCFFFQPFPFLIYIPIQTFSTLSQPPFSHSHRIYTLVYNFFLPILFSHRNLITLFLFFSYPYFSHPHPISICLWPFPNHFASFNHSLSHFFRPCFFSPLPHPCVFKFPSIFYSHKHHITTGLFYYFQLIFFLTDTLHTCLYYLNNHVISFHTYHYYFSTYIIGWPGDHQYQFCMNFHIQVTIWYTLRRHLSLVRDGIVSVNHEYFFCHIRIKISGFNNSIWEFYLFIYFLKLVLISYVCKTDIATYVILYLSMAILTLF